MDKNPFSLYDFLGYLFPGLISIMLIVYAANTDVLKEVGVFFFASHFFEVFSGYIKLNAPQSAVFIVVLSYVTGHIVAYLSSITVEYFINHLVGYPSIYLLNEIEENDLTCKQLCRIYFATQQSCELWAVQISRFIVFVLLFPVSVTLVFFGRTTHMIQFITRPLDSYIQNSIISKIGRLTDNLDLKVPDITVQADYHRIIMHYVYLNIPNSQRKADNYVAIYGFLRALTFIACSFFVFLCVRESITIWNYVSNDGVTLYFDRTVFFVFIFMFFLCNILFMGFVKFYRRFTLENFMALITDTSMVNSKR
jgi:hypothetical protein